MQNNPYLKDCKQQNGKVSDITAKDVKEAKKLAKKEWDALVQLDNNYLEQNPFAKQFSKFIYDANLVAIFNELVSIHLTKM